MAVAASFPHRSSAAWAVKAAPDYVLLSTAVGDDGESIRSAEGKGSIALVIDTDTLTPAQCQEVLYAMQDAKDGGRDIIAVVHQAKGGSAVVALACQGMALVEGASLLGAEASWCKSAAQADALASMVSKLGGADESLARRVVGGNSVMTWTAKDGFRSTPMGELTIAEQAKAVSIDQVGLQKTGLGAGSYKRERDAIDAVSKGVSGPRAASGAVGAAGSGAAGTAAPTPATGGSAAGGAPAGAAAGATAGTTSGPWGLQGDLVRLVPPKVDEYRTELAALKLELEDFNKYYGGRKGRWDSTHSSLEKVWTAKADMTRDPETKLAVSRLQASMKEKLAALDRITKWIIPKVKDKNNALVKQLTSNLEAVKTMRDAITRNKCSDYDASYPLIKSMSVK